VRLWCFLLVARFARVIALDTPHRVTQRGNARQFILTTDAERLVYVDLLRHYCTLHWLSLVGDCLMSNHVHLIVIPKQLDSLAATLKNTHGRYAAYGNAQHKSSGHVWQGRFYSCPLGGTHLAELGEALRCTELNPARASRHERQRSLRRIPILGPAPLFIAGRRHQTYRWSRDFGSSPGQPGNWWNYLAAGTSPAEADAIRESTHTGRPLGTPEFIQRLERDSGRPLVARKGGRPRKAASDSRR
jgi:putative transposase